MIRTGILPASSHEMEHFLYDDEAHSQQVMMSQFVEADGPKRKTSAADRNWTNKR